MHNQLMTQSQTLALCLAFAHTRIDMHIMQFLIPF